MDFIKLAARLTAGHQTQGAYDADSQIAANQINAANGFELWVTPRTKASMTGSELLNATDIGELALLGPEQRSEWVNFCGVDNHNPKNDGVAHKFVEYIFGNPSVTRTALITQRSESVSEAVFWEIGYTRAGDVTHARTL